jgi:hypothetical protein
VDRHAYLASDQADQGQDDDLSLERAEGRALELRQPAMERGGQDRRRCHPGHGRGQEAELRPGGGEHRTDRIRRAVLVEVRVAT